METLDWRQPYTTLFMSRRRYSSTLIPLLSPMALMTSHEESENVQDIMRVVIVFWSIQVPDVANRNDG